MNAWGGTWMVVMMGGGYLLHKKDFLRNLTNFTGDNYYGLILIISFHWITIFPSLIMASVAIFILWGALEDDKNAKM